MVVSIVAAVLNTGLGFVVVKVFAGHSELQMIGVATATLVVQVIRVGIFASVWTREQGNLKMRRPDPKLVRQLVGVTAPIALNELAWGLGNFLFGLMYIQIGTVAIAANQLAISVDNLFFATSTGLSAAASILIGQLLGAGRLLEVRVLSRAVIGFCLLVSACLALLHFSSRFAVPWLYPSIESSVLSVVIQLVVINAILQPIKVLNMVLGNGILTSGGDTAYVFRVDVCTTYLIGLPVAFLGFTVFKLGIYGIVLGRATEELVRLVWLFWRFSSNHWMVSMRVTRGEA
jgi:Na+-driven multidrug efflux pump